jgi:hypothetical protein
MTRSLVEAIDDYRFAARMPSRSGGIPKLIEAALKVARQRKKAA